MPLNTILSLNKTNVGLDQVDNTSDADKPVSTAQATADNAARDAAKAYADSLVVGLWDDRGSFDASINTYPTTGGSGSAGAILKGDIWTISVVATSGVLLGYVVGSTVRALTNTPGQTKSNWAILNIGLDYIPANVANPLSQFASTTSAQLAGIISDKTGSGSLVFATLPSLAGATFTNDLVLSDNELIRAILKDYGFTFLDKGNSSTTTQTFDYTAGSHQKVTATGNHTIATSNWPPTGNLGELLLEYANGGAYVLSWPTIYWILPDGTTSTSFATYLAANTGRTALQASGVDFIVLWSRDGGTTIYGKLI